MLDGIREYGTYSSIMSQSNYQTIRLLGGSHHGKRMVIGQLYGPLIMRKKPKRVRWTPGYQPDNVFTIEQEIYELKTVRNVIPITDIEFLVETKKAYVKKGSNVKPETLWKLGMLCDSYIECKTI